MENCTEEYRICSRCIYDSRIKGLTFDKEGVCSSCRLIEKMEEDYQTGKPEGEHKLQEIFEQIKQDGKNKQYDCVVGVSGGTDSSYLVYLAVKHGLRPLAVHYDNTWNTAIATENIRKVLGKLNVDLFTYVVDNNEADKIFRAFFEAGVPDLDAATDLALAEVTYRAADKYGVKYILEGHSYKTEGISPNGYFYFDGKYIESICKAHSNLKLKTYPLMNFGRFMKWTLVKKIKKIRPLWYIDYNKTDAMAFLQKEYDWQYYGGHHLENRITAFAHSYYLPGKFGIDARNNTLSANVRSGFLSRDEALKTYSEPPYIEDGLLDTFKKRLKLSDQEFSAIMGGPKRTYRDYKTYKQLFEVLRPLFLVLAKANLVPRSFYEKYTKKDIR